MSILRLPMYTVWAGEPPFIPRADLDGITIEISHPYGYILLSAHHDVSADREITIALPDQLVSRLAKKSEPLFESGENLELNNGLSSEFWSVLQLGAQCAVRATGLAGHVKFIPIAESKVRTNDMVVATAAAALVWMFSDPTLLHDSSALQSVLNDLTGNRVCRWLVS